MSEPRDLTFDEIEEEIRENAELLIRNIRAKVVEAEPESDPPTE